MPIYKSGYLEGISKTRLRYEEKKSLQKAPYPGPSDNGGERDSWWRAHQEINRELRDRGETPVYP